MMHIVMWQMDAGCKVVNMCVCSSVKKYIIFRMADQPGAVGGLNRQC